MTNSRTRHPRSNLPTVRMSSTADVVAAVPYLVGFTPTDSLVLISLRGSRLRSGMVARVDLPPPGRQPARLLAQDMAGHLGRDRAQQVLAVVYSDEAWDDEERPRADLIEALGASLVRESIGLREAIYVSRGRFWSYSCTRPDCCSPKGTPLDVTTSTKVAAQFVTLGRAPLASRSALVDRLRPRGPLTVAAVQAAADRCGSEHCSDAGAATEPGWRRDAVAVFGALVERARSGEVSVSSDEAGGLLCALRDIEVRDVVALRWCSYFADSPAPNREQQVPVEDPVTLVLQELVVMSDGQLAVPALTLLALQFWAAGDGAAANVAVDRALSIDPRYRMALLVDQTLRAGVPPHRSPTAKCLTG